MSCCGRSSSRLLDALSRKDETTALALIRRGKYLNKVDPIDKSTPLIRALEVGLKYPVIELISKAPSTLGLYNIDGNTGLHIACQYGPEDLAMRIDTYCNDAVRNHQNIRGMTPLMVAISSSNENIAAQLINRHKWDPDQTDHRGNTLLIWACRNGLTYITRLLLNRHQNYLKRNFEGFTAYDYAVSRGLHQISEEIKHRSRKVHPDLIDSTVYMNHQGTPKIITTDVPDDHLSRVINSLDSTHAKSTSSHDPTSSPDPRFLQ